MYVTTRPARIAGRYVPAGTILPDSFRTPGHLVTSGLVVQLPDTLTPWPDDEPEPESTNESASDSGEEPESDATLIADKPAQDGDTEPIGEDINPDELDVSMFHTGAGWYKFDDETDPIRGEKAAQKALAKRLGG